MKIIARQKIAIVAAALVSNKSGDTSLRFALIVGAVAIVSALMVPVAMEGNSMLASYDRQNVDTIVTGSVKKPKRYLIRKSVLDN